MHRSLDGIGFSKRSRMLLDELWRSTARLLLKQLCCQHYLQGTPVLFSLVLSLTFFPSICELLLSIVHLPRKHFKMNSHPQGLIQFPPNQAQHGSLKPRRKL